MPDLQQHGRDRAFQAQTRSDRRFGRPERADPVEELAAAALSRRELLLRVHSHRLRREDLEDCYSQATLELLKHVQRGGRFASSLHLTRSLEQRFLSRVRDRRRALSGRSPMQAALEGAVPLEDRDACRIDVADTRAELEQLVIFRHELRRLRALAAALSSDQRLVLAMQLAHESQEEFCARHGWSKEKYRKVAQRARARLRALMALEDSSVQSRPRPS
ncbi:MAG TPA: hypothetical protein VKV16_03650 [Solirubrobacteraceae bacterium]|nr:hypothetical protein [Solirubrobacteraceae bacterium]